MADCPDELGAGHCGPLIGFEQVFWSCSCISKRLIPYHPDEPPRSWLTSRKDDKVCMFCAKSFAQHGVYPSIMRRTSVPLLHTTVADCQPTTMVLWSFRRKNLDDTPEDGLQRLPADWNFGDWAREVVAHLGKGYSLETFQYNQVSSPCTIA
jgi:hypothetical protein